MGELLYKGRSLNTTPEDICYENEARNMRVGDAGGKNLIPYPYSNKSGNYNGVEITINDDYSISVNGTNTGNRNDFGFAGISRISDIPYMVSLKEGKSYTLSLEFFRGSLPDTSDVVINGWNDNSVVMLLAVCDSSVTSFTFTVPADSGIKHGCVYLQNKSGTVFDNVRLRPMLTEGNEVVPYEPYIPSVKMLAEENVQQNTEAMDLKMLGWTVPRECPVQNYTDANGVFHQRVGRVDLGSLTWSYESNYKRFSTMGITDYKNKDSTNTWVADAFLKGYSTTTGNNTANDGYNKTIGFNGTSKTFFVKNTSYTDATSFKNAMQGQYLYYELETEIKKNVDGNEFTNDYTSEEKTKLGGIEDGANKTVIDTELNTTSENPVQNKVLNQYFNEVKNEISSIRGLDLIWNNTGNNFNSTESYSETQSVEVSEKYDTFMIFFNTGGVNSIRNIANAEVTTTNVLNINNTEYDLCWAKRRFYMDVNTTPRVIKFEPCYYRAYKSGSTYKLANDSLIPVRIYGIKK